MGRYPPTAKCPAPAGMIPIRKLIKTARAQMPRNCGDDPYTLDLLQCAEPNAPHLRG